MTSTCCKVGEAIDEYQISTPGSFESVNSYLVARWKGQNGNPEASVRILTKWFNLTLIKGVYKNHGRNTIETRVESDYEVLKGTEENAKLDIIDDLRVYDIDAEKMAGSFISPSTLVRHFNNCLGEHKPKKEAAKDSTWESDKISFVQHTMENTAEECLNSLGEKGRIAGASEATISIPVILECGDPDCATRCSYERALNRGYICEVHNDAADDNVDMQATQND